MQKVGKEINLRGDASSRSIMITATFVISESSRLSFAFTQRYKFEDELLNRSSLKLNLEE